MAYFMTLCLGYFFSMSGYRVHEMAYFMTPYEQFETSGCKVYEMTYFMAYLVSSEGINCSCEIYGTIMEK